jgi:hypothetical protein
MPCFVTSDAGAPLGRDGLGDWFAESICKVFSRLQRQGFGGAYGGQFGWLAGVRE